MPSLSKIGDLDVLVDAKNREILCKQHASTEKMLRSPNILWLFLRTLVIALTIHVGIMRICCCPMQIFAIY